MKKILMPESLTAKNGAKAAFTGEFSEIAENLCPECDGFGKDRQGDVCSFCDGDSEVIEEIIISWSTIKDIYAKAVEMFREE